MRYTLPHNEIQRAKLVLYAAEGLTNVEIGAPRDQPEGGRTLAKTLL